MTDDYIIDFKSLPKEAQDGVREIHGYYHKNRGQSANYGKDQWQMGYDEGQCEVLETLFGEDFLSEDNTDNVDEKTVIFEDVKRQNNSLWMSRPRGDSLEIITPFGTITSKYISVFLTTRENKWIVSDGGCLSTKVYSDYVEDDVIKFFMDDYDVKTTQNKYNEDVYYLSTEEDNMVARIVYELSSFIMNVVNTMQFQKR